METMLRKKAVEPRTKPTLSDIFPFINRIVYIELCSLHAVIGVSWSILCPTLAQPLKDSRLKSGTEANLANINNADAK